jgi:hypothetical protein
MAWTRSDGWVWVFAYVDHYTAEAWAHVAKVGDRFAALQPVYDAVIDRWGAPGPDVARGLSLRHDWGPQYRSAHVLGSIGWLGIADDAAFLASRRPTAAPNAGSAPQGAVPVDRATRQRRGGPPGRGRLCSHLQHPVADRPAPPPHPKEAYQDAHTTAAA